MIPKIFKMKMNRDFQHKHVHIRLSGNQDEDYQGIRISADIFIW